MLNVAFLVLPVALLAGGAALLVELSWLRAVSGRLPGTLPAAALVVPAFLTAWTCGSAWAGRLADRREGAPGQAARWLAGAALAAWALPPLGALVADLLPAEGLVGRLLVGGLPAVPVAVGLGGALPWLSRVRVGRGLGLSRATGGVAAATALGAALACWCWADWWLAGHDAARLGALALAVAAALCWGLERFGGRATEPGPEGATTRPEPVVHTRRLATLALGWAALLAGAALVSGQLSALRLMAQAEGDSLATTTRVLAVLHLGMAAGALAMAPAWPRLGAGALVGLLACAALAGVALATPDAVGADRLAAGIGLGAGSLVTAASRALPRAGAGRWVGDLAALSTLGGVLGGLAHSRLLGGVGTGGLLAGLAAVLALAVLPTTLMALLQRGSPAVSRLASAVALTAALLLAGVTLTAEPLTMPWQTSPEETTLLQQREGPHGVVSLVGTDTGGTRLKLDNRFGLGGSSGARLEQRLGRLAACLAPEAERALLLGVGRGHTLAGLAGTTRARVTAVERNAEILALDLPLPQAGPGGPRGGPPEVLHADARAWIAEHPRSYDLIVGDLFFPWVTGAGELLGLEQLHTVRRALDEHGVYVQWLPLHQLPWPAFGSVVSAFLEVFPTARLFVATPLAGQPLVALAGGMLRGLPDGDAVDALLADVPWPDGLNTMADVYDLHVADQWALERRFGDRPPNRRAWPGSELLSLGRQGDETWLSRTNMRLLADLTTPLSTASLSRPPGDSRTRRFLDRELVARGDALQALLLARAALLELAARPRLDDRPEERERWSRQIDAALVAAWSVFPGHLGARTALIEWTGELTSRGLWGDAAGLLAAVLEIHGEPRLAGVLGGVFVRLDLAEDALPLLRQARDAAPRDLTVALHLAAALLHVGGHDGEAAAILADARELGRGALPPLHGTALALLEGRPGADHLGSRALASIPAEEPWAASLARLLEAYRQES